MNHGQLQSASRYKLKTTFERRTRRRSGKNVVIVQCDRPTSARPNGLAYILSRFPPDLHTYLAQGTPWSIRRLPQDEAPALHSAGAEACDFPKRGKLGRRISGSGGSRSRGPWQNNWREDFRRGWQFDSFGWMEGACRKGLTGWQAGQLATTRTFFSNMHTLPSLVSLWNYKFS